MFIPLTSNISKTISSNKFPCYFIFLLFGAKIVQIKKLSINNQLYLGWKLLYEIEIIEDMPLTDILERLKTTAECIANIRTRKRISQIQQEKLINLEKWYQSYDIKRLQKDIKKQSKTTKSNINH